MKYIPYVNTKQGSRTGPRFSNGNTLPFTQLPFAMTSFVPQTDGGRGLFFFHPDDRSLEGIRLTHQPSVWLGDYGTFLFMPQAGKPLSLPHERWSDYKPEAAVLRPDYLRVRFIRCNTLFELAPTARGAILRFDFGTEEQPYLSLLPAQGCYRFCLDSAAQRVVGWSDGHSPHDDTKDFRMYFVLQFEPETCDEANTIAMSADGSAVPGHLSEGEGISLHVALKKRRTTVRMAISYISEEQALLNLAQDTAGFDFDQLRARSEAIWEEYLSRIEIESDDEDQLRTFYSCLYRTFLFPHKAYELNDAGEPIHYCPIDGLIRPGVRYTDNGFWDTYRTVYPLFSLIAREEYAEMLEGFVQDYRDGGYLPRWPTIGETGCMPSTLIDAVIADAAVKGIVKGEVLETAFEGMLHHATTQSSNPQLYGRMGMEEFERLGYVPMESARSSVNVTLDAAYGDFCIAEVARLLGRTEEETRFRRRAQNYRHLFDPQTGFMRARDRDGNWKPGNFDPFLWAEEYCESSAWPSTLNVPHDIEGLTSLFGGPSQFEAKLDELFATPPIYHIDQYGPVHEMTELASADFGQCAISNQPSFLIPFLFAAIGRPEKTDYWVGRICREAFSWRDDGFLGDEDNGTMAAWYIFSTLGLYPACPGKPEFLRCRMQVKSARIAGKPWNSAEHGPVIPYSALVCQE